jgi:putative addiction module killer protein
MPVFPFDIEYYITREGKKPFKAWLESVKDLAGRAKVRVALDCARLGNLGDNSSVGEGVRELRVDYGSGCRIYFAIDDRRLMLLLLGLRQSGEQRDAATAREYWQDYKERKKTWLNPVPIKRI